MKNLEIKCRLNEFTAARRVLLRLGAARQSPVLRQVDWYFSVPRGRFKLRQINGGPGELIFYIRPTRRAARLSTFGRLPVPDVAETRRLLARALGENACVRKRRELWLFENARIHLDQVDGLGRFLEIEVVVARGVRQARALMNSLARELNLSPSRFLAHSYSELLPRTKTARSPRVRQ